MRIGLFYATNTGYTEEVSEELCQHFGTSLIETCQNIEDLSLEDLQGFDVLLLGIATWDAGDLPYDWAMFYDGLVDYDFSNTTIVMFGLGDQGGYPETFLDAMGILYRRFLEQGATGGIGFWPTDDYSFEESLALEDGQFCGLALDQDNEADLTTDRLIKWCTQIKRELNILKVCDSDEPSAGDASSASVV